MVESFLFVAEERARGYGTQLVQVQVLKQVAAGVGQRAAFGFRFVKEMELTWVDVSGVGLA